MRIIIIKLFFDAKSIECNANKIFAFETQTQTRPKHDAHIFNLTLMTWKWKMSICEHVHQTKMIKMWHKYYLSIIFCDDKIVLKNEVIKMAMQNRTRTTHQITLFFASCKLEFFAPKKYARDLCKLWLHVAIM